MKKSLALALGALCLALNLSVSASAPTPAPRTIVAVTCHQCYLALAQAGDALFVGTDPDDQKAIASALEDVPDSVPVSVSVVWRP